MTRGHYAVCWLPAEWWRIAVCRHSSLSRARRHERRLRAAGWFVWRGGWERDMKSHVVPDRAPPSNPWSV
jgi:hypothetical protein